MKKIPLILFIIISKTIFAQDSLLKEDVITFVDCENYANETSNCFKSKTLAFIDKNLSKKIKKKLIKASKKDTIEFYTKLFFNKQGQVITHKSTLKNSVDHPSKNFNVILEKFPKINPRLDNIGNPTESYNVETFAFKIEGKKLIPIRKYEPLIKELILLDSQPVYFGCSSQAASRGTRLNCLNRTIKKMIGKKFNADIANRIDMPSGIAKIYVFFRINKLGEIDDIRARSTRVELEEETIRVIKSLPKAEKPGMYKGKPREAHFVIPIKFRID